MELRMIGQRVLVRAEDQKEYTQPNGIIVVEAYAPEVIGTVVECGDVHEVKPGDVVLFAPEAGQVMDLDGDRYLVLDESEILAVWDEEKTPV